MGRTLGSFGTSVYLQINLLRFGMQTCSCYLV